jgi:hypothetical protein
MFTLHAVQHPTHPDRPNPRVVIQRFENPLLVAQTGENLRFGKGSSNPSAPLNSRAILFPRCATGYQNPDTLSCVSPGDVNWVEGIGFPNAATVGRNTLRTGGTNNFDLNLTKSIPFGETWRSNNSMRLNADRHYVNAGAALP